MNKLRPDAYYALKKALEKAEYIYTGCINCENFDEPRELCKLANARPPAKVIVFGCPKWDGGIPF